MPIFLSRGVREAVTAFEVPVILVTNLLTEGCGMEGFSAATAAARIGEVPRGCEVVTGEFWQGTFARHARRRLAYAVWGLCQSVCLVRTIWRWRHQCACQTGSLSSRSGGCRLRDSQCARWLDAPLCVSANCDSSSHNICSSSRIR